MAPDARERVAALSTAFDNTATALTIEVRLREKCERDLAAEAAAHAATNKELAEALAAAEESEASAKKTEEELRAKVEALDAWLRTQNDTLSSTQEKLRALSESSDEDESRVKSLVEEIERRTDVEANMAVRVHAH